MNVAEARPSEQMPEQTIGTGERARKILYVACSAALIFGAILLDNDKGTGQLEFLIVLLGPLLTGLAMRLRGRPWKLGAASWALTGLVMLAFDWIVNNEDQAFHLVLTLLMAALVALGAAIGRMLAGARSRLVRPT